MFVILFAQSFPNLFVQFCAHLTYIYKYNIQKMYCQVFMKKNKKINLTNLKMCVIIKTVIK